MREMLNALDLLSSQVTTALLHSLLIHIKVLCKLTDFNRSLDLGKGATAGSVQGSLLALRSGITPGSARDQTGVGQEQVKQLNPWTISQLLPVRFY